MGSHYAPLAVKNAGYELERFVPDVLIQPPSAESYSYISRLYRRVAVGTLLCTGHPGEFYEYLFDSSRAFLHFVRTAAETEKVTSQAEAFLDAIACRDEEGARGIAEASRRTLNHGKEYEEDFLYLSLLMKWAYLDSSEPELGTLLEEWRRYTEENPDTRFDVCRALLASDQATFDAAIETAIQDKVDDWEAQREAELLDPDDASTICRVSTEVLAWIELATRNGLRVKPEYRLAPSTARQFHCIASRDPDHWRRPEGFSSGL
jgi:hypothetical protein